MKNSLLSQSEIVKEVKSKKTIGYPRGPNAYKDTLNMFFESTDECDRFV